MTLSGAAARNDRSVAGNRSPSGRRTERPQIHRWWMVAGQPGAVGADRRLDRRPGSHGRPASVASSRSCGTASRERIRARPGARRAARPGAMRCPGSPSFSAVRCSPWAQSSASSTSAARATVDWTFLIGGFFFSTGAYAALVQEINSPRSIDADGALERAPMAVVGLRAEPARLAGRLRAVRRDARLRGEPDRRLPRPISAQPQLDSLIWAPEMVGCVLFLVQRAHRDHRGVPRPVPVAAALARLVARHGQPARVLALPALRPGRVRPAGHR